MKKNILQLLLLLLPFISNSQADSVYYHDYSFESQYGASGAYPSQDYMQMISRFTPTSYPAQLIGITAWFRNATSPAPYKIIVRQDPLATGSANNSTQIYIGTALPNPSSNGVPDSAYEAYVDLTAANLIFMSGDVYAGVTQNLAQNGFIGLALDTNVNVQFTDRSWISTSQGSSGSWMQFVNWSFIPSQLAITAFFNALPNVIEEMGKQYFKIYPDPVTDKFFINGIGSEKCSIKIFNLEGKLMKEFLSELNHDYNISFLDPGIYVVEIKNQEVSNHIKILKL